MAKFNLINTPINGLKLVEVSSSQDSRGFFMETWNKHEFEKLGINVDFVQDNHSRSKKGVLRGLHFQAPYSQAKLVRCVRGAVFDVAVDLRQDSKTFCQWYGIILGDVDKKMFFIPENFAHGFLALTDNVDFLYKTSEYYHPEYDRGIIWNDPELNIAWPLDQFGINKAIVSEKDSKLLTLKDYLINADFNNRG